MIFIGYSGGIFKKTFIITHDSYEQALEEFKKYLFANRKYTHQVFGIREEQKQYWEDATIIEPYQGMVIPL